MLSAASGNRKDKSLRIMSQKFVSLFLVSKTQTVTLEAAAKVLIEESQDLSSHGKYKSEHRRRCVALFPRFIKLNTRVSFSQGTTSL